jgi:hypothetical protein
MSISLPQATLAVGALGSAATGLVDSTKVLAGGISHAGFGYIKQLIARTVPKASGAQSATGLTTEDILETLLANWMNGMDTGAQKAIARSFIKMHLNPATAAALAKEVNVDPASLTSVANKLASMESLQTSEADTYGRFDVAISALVDRAYERGDQFYRNSCKALAAVFAIGLAFAGDYSLNWVLTWWQAVVIGLIATPLAPVAKDFANAIQTASDAVGAVKG